MYVERHKPTPSEWLASKWEPGACIVVGCDDLSATKVGFCLSHVRRLELHIAARKQAERTALQVAEMVASPERRQFSPDEETRPEVVIRYSLRIDGVERASYSRAREALKKYPHDYRGASLVAIIDYPNAEDGTRGYREIRQVLPTPRLIRRTK